MCVFVCVRAEVLGVEESPVDLQDVIQPEDPSDMLKKKCTDDFILAVQLLDSVTAHIKLLLRHDTCMTSSNKNADLVISKVCM